MNATENDKILLLHLLVESTNIQGASKNHKIYYKQTLNRFTKMLTNRSENNRLFSDNALT